jgi:hypothetical protein
MGTNTLESFLAALRNLDANYTATQDFYNTQLVTDNKLVPEILDVIENYRNHYRRFQATAPQPVTHSAFATLNGQQQENTKDSPKSGSNFRDKPNCLCGLKHLHKDYWYINPSTRPKNFEPKDNIFQKINTEISKPSRAKLLQKFLKFFKYDRFTQMNISLPLTAIPKVGFVTIASALVLELLIPEIKGTFAATYSAFTESSQAPAEYKLYNSWTLDNASDIYICNDLGRNEYTETRTAISDDILYSSKTAYQIESFGTVRIVVDTPERKRKLKLGNVALVPGFMTNLVSLSLLISKGIYWNSRKPERLESHDFSDFCYFHANDKH